ncbi:Uncharacterised protein [uncultured Comamonas sp.]|nr:Uncharacterised protein [uncultured Comamonas sp.]
MSEQPPASLTPPPQGYASLLADLKQRVRQAQVRAMQSVNAELIRLYWGIGQTIHERQQQEGWGAGVIPRLARDLQNELPEEKGFSERNIKQMLAFYREYAQLPFVQQPAAQIEAEQKMPQTAALFTAELILVLPWTHHTVLMAKVKDHATRRWYMQAALEHGWTAQHRADRGGVAGAGRGSIPFFLSTRYLSVFGL